MGGGLSELTVGGRHCTEVEGQLPGLGGPGLRGASSAGCLASSEAPGPQPSSPQIQSPSAPLPDLAPVCSLESWSWAGAGRWWLGRNALCSVPQGGSSRKHAAEQARAGGPSWQLQAPARPC